LWEHVFCSENVGNKERIGRLVRMHANHREEVKEIPAGDIAAVIGLKDTTTGNTLCDENRQLHLEKIVFPEPVIKIAVEPKTKADQEKMGVALSRLAEEDPTFRVETDEETNQTLISGMGELHLDVIVDRMKREFNVEANIGNPQVSYRETIRETAEAENKYIKQSGGRGQYGHVKIKVSPKEPGEGFEFLDEIKGGVIPKEYIPAVRKGIEEAMTKGVIAGYPMVDIQAILYDGTFHDVDSSEAAFKIAGSMAFQEAARAAKPTLLEPVMRIEVTIPDEFFGDIVGNLNSRRGRIKESFDRGKMKVIEGFVPLSEMFGYATALRSMTHGRGGFSIEFSHYEKVPGNITEAIVEGKQK